MTKCARLKFPMHELAICRALLKQVEAVAAQQRACGVERITLRIGPLAGVQPELLEQAFLSARGGTCAAAAQLVIVPEALRVRCRECGAVSAATVNNLVCAQCGGWRTQLLSGAAMLLQSVELTLPNQETSYV